jgi:hypothetical protein
VRKYQHERLEIQERCDNEASPKGLGDRNGKVRDCDDRQGVLKQHEQTQARARIVRLVEIARRLPPEGPQDNFGDEVQDPREEWVQWPEMRHDKVIKPERDEHLTVNSHIRRNKE